jgi:tetratricopeptide (TPR) repeat protein
MDQEEQYKEALEAIRLGQRKRAHDLLTRLLLVDSSNAEYWLLMSSLVNTQTERIMCLESALRADPNNEAARNGLIILGASPAGSEEQPEPDIRRLLGIKPDKEVGSLKLFWDLWDNPRIRLLMIIGTVILLVGVMGVICSLQRQRQPSVAIYRVSPFPTHTPGFTETSTPTRTLVVRSPTPTYIGPTPLWMFLAETYTPMPLYINTPHPVIEAYRIGIDAYQNNQIEQMLDYMNQAVTVAPDQPDLSYYAGEAHRLLGQFDEAIVSYENALIVNPDFAPAYLGLALATLGLNQDDSVEANLAQAILEDSNFVDAYLTRAAYWLEHEQPELAMQDLSSAERAFPGMPMIYVLTAQAYLSMGDNANALQNAQLGYQADRTLLPAYLTLAQSYLVNQNPEQALYYAEIYIRYESDDPVGWVIVGQGHYLRGEGNYEAALDAFNQALAVDEESPEAYRFRGLTYLAIGDSGRAVDDLLHATGLLGFPFDYTIDLARAYWANGQLSEAVNSFSTAENRAETEAQQAIVYYYRAQVYEQINNLVDARIDYQALVLLPTEAVPQEWRLFAEQRISELKESTPTVTPNIP